MRGGGCGGVGESNKQVNSCKKSAFSGQVKLLFSTPNNQEKIITRSGAAFFEISVDIYCSF